MTIAARRKVARVGLDGSVRHRRRGADGPRPRPALYRRQLQRRPRRRRSPSPAAAPAPGRRRSGPRRRPSAQLTRLNAELLDGKRLGEGRNACETTSSYDQRPIEAWLDPSARPAEGQRVPADPRDPRRPVRRLRPAFLDRQSALRRRRLRRALGQPARLDLLRRGIRATSSTTPIPATTMTI